jgi:non-ribosomal peptide synthetase component E (peptide arylation enzyme)
MGRRRDVIIRGGQNIYPKEVEDLLLQHQKLSEVTIVRMPDREMGEKACAYVVPRRGQTFTFDEMISFLKSKKIAPFKMPERLEVIAELPLAPAGNKVDVIKLENDIIRKLADEARKPNINPA